MTEISFTESEQKDLSIKPKLLVITTCILYGFAVIVASRSSLKNAKYFHIPKIRRNMLRNLNSYSYVLIFTHFSVQLGESRQGDLSANSSGYRRPVHQCRGGVFLLGQAALQGISHMVELPLRYNHHLPSPSQHLDLLRSEQEFPRIQDR